MNLLERDAALAALTSYAAEARAGEGRVVLLSGEAGVGKTVLVDALREQTTDARWLWGACEGSFTPRPLGPVYDVAEQTTGPLNAAARASDAPRHVIFRAVLDELTSATTDQLTILCLEDVHWADEATLDLLQFLAPRLRTSRTMLLATFRDDGLAPDHPLRMTLGELSTERARRRIELQPLSADAVAQLAGGSGIRARDLHALTGGNPFLVTEVLATGQADIPPSARDAVLARVARLSPPARGALEIAAVIGSRVDVDLLRDTFDGPDGAIDECLTAGALVSDDRAFRFRHELARRAVEDAMPAHRRTEVHRRVLELLEKADDADPAQLAHHADGAGDSEAVLRAAPKAAERASKLGAHRQAAVQLARALHHAPQHDLVVRATLLEALGEEHAFDDRWQDAVDAQLEALALWREVGDPLRIGNLLRIIARTMWRLCRGDESNAAALEAVRILEQQPRSIEYGWAVAMLGIMAPPGAPDTETCFATARAIAEQFDDLALLSYILNSEGGLKACTGEDGAPEMRASLELAKRADAQDQVGRGYTNLHSVLANDYLLDEADALYREGMDYFAGRDLGTHAHCLRGGQAWVFEKQGRWDEAEELLVFDLEERALSPINKISKLVVVGAIAARRGRSDAETILDEALQLALDGGQLPYIVEVGTARLEAAWLNGDVESIRAEADRVVAALDDKCPPNYHSMVTLWLRRCGLPDAPPVPGDRSPYSLHVAGQFRDAADGWLALGCLYDAALALLDSEDQDAMQEALRILEKLGAVATVARAQATMRRLGFTSIPRGARAQTKANRFGLTRREQEVLDLLGDGLTNGEIGARLFIAEKTVDHHVSSVLAKMNVASRREAARLAKDAVPVAT